jgi:cell division septum initiation protein DivIVA
MGINGFGLSKAKYRTQGRAQQEIDAANQASQLEMDKMKANYQREIDQLRASQAQARPPPQPQQSVEYPIAKLKKLADLKQQGILTEEEFQKMKAILITPI